MIISTWYFSLEIIIMRRFWPFIFSSNFSNNENFKRKSPGRNNHNAPKLIEKYNDLAREASSNGDKILSENYFQHADHFTRILNEQESLRKAKFAENKIENDETSEEKNVSVESTSKNKIIDETQEKKIAKSQQEIN